MEKYDFDCMIAAAVQVHKRRLSPVDFMTLYDLQAGEAWLVLALYGKVSNDELFRLLNLSREK